MAGPSTVSLHIPAYRNPTQFGADVVALGSDTDSLEVLVLQDTFEEAGLDDLAIVLSALRGDVAVTPGSPLSRENLSKTIAEIATRDGEAIQRALAGIQEGSAASSLFGDSAQLRAELLRRLRARSQEVEIGGGLLDFDEDSIIRPRGFEGDDEVQVAGPSAVALISFPSVSAVNDEERLAGTVWQALYLPQVLLAAIKVKGHPIELALDVLEDQSQPLVLKVMALRLLGDNIEAQAIATLQGFLKVVGVVRDTFEQAKDPRLKEMAAAVLRKFDFSEGARFPISPELAGRVKKAEGVFPARRSSFEPVLDRWQSDYPPWVSVLNQYLGIEVGFGDEFPKARKIFSDKSQPDYRRALALTYYSYLLLSLEGAHLARAEADVATQSLLTIIQDNLPNGQLSHMAAVVYARVVVDQVNADSHFQSSEEEKRATLEWATARGTDLDRALPPSAVAQRRNLQSIQAILHHLSQLLSYRKPAGQRFGEWLLRRGR